MSSNTPSRRQFLKRLSLATGALFASQWVSTSSGQEASSTATTAAPKQYGPYLQNPSDTEMSILWTTEKPALSWVEYWPADNPGERKVAQEASFGLRQLKSPNHAVTLKGLKPGTQYSYKVYSRPKNGREPDVIEMEKGSTAKDGSFSTLNKNSDTCDIIIVNDMHGRGEVMANLLEQGKAETKDLIFHNGDICNWLSEDYQIEKTIITPTQKYLANTPLLFVRGNHEYRGSKSLDITKPFPPRNGQYYYLLRQGPVCFVVLDTGEDKADDRKELFGVTDWVNYFNEQAEWLKTAVEDPLFKNAPYRIAIQHIPSTPSRGDRVNYTGELIREKWFPSLNKGKVHLMICAHTHRNMYLPASEEHGNAFDTLVNDNKGYVTLKAGKKELVVTQYDKDSNQLKEVKRTPDA